MTGRHRTEDVGKYSQDGRYRQNPLQVEIQVRINVNEAWVKPCISRKEKQPGQEDERN